MPFNKLHVPESFSSQTCHALNALLHDCLVETCGVVPDDDFCLINRYSPEDMIINPICLGNRDPAATVVIEIALLSGRTEAQKEALYAAVRHRMPGIGLKPENSIIYLLENSAIDWSFSEVGSVKRALAAKAGSTTAT